MTPEPNAMIGGRYRVIAPLSSGAMASVYRALDTTTGVEVALKHQTDARHAERFEVEARLLSLLRHPRVVRVVDYLDDDSGQYLVMDLVEGPDLDAVLKARGAPGLPIAEAIGYARQCCEALDYVHAQQVIHRDVKPRNVILSRDGVVLVDFGIATVLDEDEAGTIGIGTPRFMAPEVLTGGSVSPRSDVFGLAATLWTLIAGKPPVYGQAIPLRDLAGGVTPALERALIAGLELIPERRVASVAALAKALGPPIERTSGESLAMSVDRPDAPRRLIEGITRAAAGVFEAAAASIALLDATTDELVFQAAWGTGAREIVGVRLPPNSGIAGKVVQSGEPEMVPDCRNSPLFAARIAAGTGYVPHSMLVVPLLRDGRPIGVLSLLDRRDGARFGPVDVERAALFAELAVTALGVQPDAFTSLGVPL
ncbi:MAG TPA: protein kinase [Solirubrobacteraceae bacterium]|jgi:GAF domain-containing protein|nr:protein kinase [Solirubrobacteraceae bacterium]